MPAEALYDDVADWYENEFLSRQRFGAEANEFADRLGIDEALVHLLGPGTGTCLEIGCGTGIYAERVSELGRQPVGVDISAAMLGFAQGRLPIARGDACRLPFASESVPAAVAIMVHTDMLQYEQVLAEIHRVLEPGGTFVHIGVHPCFCGGFADATDPATGVIIKPGYLDQTWTKHSWTDQGLRDKVGANHVPLAPLLNMVAETGFRLQEFREGAVPTPIVLSFRATRD